MVMEKKRKELLIDEINFVHPKKKSKNSFICQCQPIRLHHNTSNFMYDEKGN